MLHSEMGVMLLRGTKPCGSRPGDEGSAPTAACSMGYSAELANSSLRMLMGEMVSSQLVIPKSLRWALAWLESPARVSKPAPQNSHRIRLNVLGSKFATFFFFFWKENFCSIAFTSSAEMKCRTL